jgi:polyhydroxyalkanoate synthase
MVRTSPSQPSLPKGLFTKTQEELEHQVQRFEQLLALGFNPPQVPVGLTPKEEIWSKNKTRLYRYVPVKDTLYPVPVLLIYALINRPYILDLTPGNSFIEYLVGQGFDVYLLDWGVAGDEDKNLKFDDYVLDYLPRAIQKVLKTSGAETFTLLGYCIGATIAALYAGQQQRVCAPDGPLKNMVLLTAPIDFTDADLFSVWLDKRYFDVDRLVDTFGNIPPEFMDFGNKLLKPITNFLSTYTNLYDRMYDERFVNGWRAMNQWVNDGVPFPGEAYRQWVKEFYQQNALARGTFKLRGRPVNLANITCPLLNIAAERDHIVQLPQATRVMDLVGSADKEFVVMPGGHVGLVVGRAAVKTLWPKVSSWIAERSR